jgi:hypothetical protein
VELVLPDSKKPSPVNPEIAAHVRFPRERSEPRRITMQLGRSPISLGDLVKAQLVRPGQVLSFRKSPTLAGVVTQAGTIKLNEIEYASPSTAAKSACGGASTNGWHAWYLKESDEWVSLAALRDRLLAP